jgi:DNA-binding GntR family transcriptional regulator
LENKSVITIPSSADASRQGEQHVSLSEQAYEVILRRILKGTVPIGGELSRRRLAVELGMSILPVSEALQRLQNEGIVESRSRVGTRVRVPTATDVRERYEIREALESQTARIFCRVASPADRAEMVEMAKQLDALYDRCFNGGENDPEFLYSVQETHAGFHLRIAEVSGCRALCKTLETNRVLTFNWLYYIAAKRPPLPPSFHSDLIAALCTGDEEVADRAMRAHVRHGLEYVVSCITPDLASAATR